MFFFILLLLERFASRHPSCQYIAVAMLRNLCQFLPVFLFRLVCHRLEPIVQGAVSHTLLHLYIVDVRIGGIIVFLGFLPSPSR